MAVGAAQAHTAGGMHALAIDRSVASGAHAAPRLGLGFFRRLADKKFAGGSSRFLRDLRFRTLLT